MNALLARQAIFDRTLSVHGYEILIRDGDLDLLVSPQATQAGPALIEKSLHAVGLGALTMGKKGFFNVTRPMLAMNLASLLPAGQSVIEIVHTLDPDAEVVAAAAALKKQGYQVAVDAYTARKGMAPLLALADIVKIDFRETVPEEQKAASQRYAKPGTRMLADGVRTQGEFQWAKQSGYALFQGFFFQAPEIVDRKEIPAYKFTYLRLLQEANRREIDFDLLEETIRQDVALSLKLLRYINSAMFALRGRVESIKQALVLLGPPAVRKWVSLLAIASMGDDRPGELVLAALVRGRLCEVAAEEGALRGQAFDAFLVGMLSTADALLGRPMSEIVADLPISIAAKEAVLGGTAGPLGRLLKLAQAWERADWSRLKTLNEGFGLAEARLPALYAEAAAWADRIFQMK